MKHIFLACLLMLWSVDIFAQSSSSGSFDLFHKKDRKKNVTIDGSYADDAYTDERVGYFIGSVIPKNDTAKIGQYLATGIEINAPSADQSAPSILMFAIRFADKNTVEYFLKHRADPNLRIRYKHQKPFGGPEYYEFSEYPLEIAADVNDLEKMELLIRYGADVNKCLDKLRKIASNKGNIDMMELLGKESGSQGVDKNAVAVITEFNFQHDVSKVTPKIIEKLLKNGADVNAYTGSGKTALINAIIGRDIKDRIALAKVLLANGADPNLEDRVADSYGGNMKFYPTSPISYASQYGNLGMVKLLVEHGAKDLHSALANTKSDEIKEYLILKGAK